MVAGYECTSCGRRHEVKVPVCSVCGSEDVRAISVETRPIIEPKPIVEARPPKETGPAPEVTPVKPPPKAPPPPAVPVKGGTKRLPSVVTPYRPRPTRWLVASAVIGALLLLFVFALLLTKQSPNKIPVTQGSTGNQPPPTPPHPSTGPSNGNPKYEETNSNSNTSIETEPPALATLRISSNTGGITLYIDGVAEGALSAGQPRLMRLAPGMHRAYATKTGYKDWEQSFSLRANAQQNLSIELEALGPTPQEKAAEYLRSAESLFQNGQYDGAIAACNQGLSIDPGNDALLRKKAQVERARQEALNRAANDRPPIRTQPQIDRSAATSPPQPASPAYQGPRQGTILRSVKLDENEQLIINDGLPGVPVIIEGIEPKGQIGIVEPPSPSNGWRRLVLRSRKSMHVVVTVSWRILRDR